MKNRKSKVASGENAEEPVLSKQERAQKAMFSRSRKENNPMMPYYIVTGVFTVICIAAILVTFVTPKQNIADKEIIDASEMFVHNGQGHQFKHGENKIFHKKTLREAKHMFQSALSDTNSIGTCRTSKKFDEKIQGDFEEMEIELPDAYDWREAYPQCV